MVQAELVKWVEAQSVPKLPSLDRSPKNKKALQKAFADQKPKVLGVMGTESDGLQAFKDALVAVKEAVDGVHVRFDHLLVFCVNVLLLRVADRMALLLCFWGIPYSSFGSAGWSEIDLAQSNAQLSMQIMDHTQTCAMCRSST